MKAHALMNGHESPDSHCESQLCAITFVVCPKFVPIRIARHVSIAMHSMHLIQVDQAHTPRKSFYLSALSLYLIWVMIFIKK